MSDTIYTCPTCESTYDSFGSYKKHVLKVHGTSRDNVKSKAPAKRKFVPVECEICKTMYSSAYALKKHQTRTQHIPVPISPNYSYTEPRRLGTYGNGTFPMRVGCTINRHPTVQEPAKPSTPKSFPLLQVTPETIAAIAELIKATASSTTTKSHNANNSYNTNQTDNSTNNIDNSLTQNNTNHNNLIINQDIKINPLGKENLDHITEADKLEFLHLGSGAVPALARAILELPENRNMAICDKKAGKVMFVNRKGKVEIANLDKVIGWFTDDNIGRINNYITEYDDKFSPNDKLIQRLKILQGHETIDTDDEEEHDNKYQGYFIACSSQIRDAIELNSKPALKNIKKFRDIKSRELSGHQIPNIQLPTLN